jgi:hypothetical protein
VLAISETGWVVSGTLEREKLPECFIESFAIFCAGA